MTYLEALKEQVIRDLQTLRMDPEFQAPSRQFYVDRIASYREAIAELEAQS